MSDQTFTVSAHVWRANANHFARTAEVLARAAAGLALEGIAVSIHVGPTEEEDDE